MYVPPTSHTPQFVIGAGDVVAATLPNLRSLKKVMVKNMNPVPLLQAVGLCGKLEVVVVNFAKHCVVGERCAYCLHMVLEHSQSMLSYWTTRSASPSPLHTSSCKPLSKGYVHMSNKAL